MLRTLLAGSWILLAIVVAGPLGLLASWLSGSPRPLFALALPAIRTTLRLAGVRVRVRGRERLTPGVAYVFAANHTSNADPPVLFVAIGRDVRVLGKAALFSIPLFGRILRRAGMIPVHRDDRERAIGAVDDAAAALRAGHDFLVFPEGTRSPDGRLQTLKKGPFVMAIKGVAPIVPVAVRGTRSIQPKGGVRIRPGEVLVEFLEPIPTAGLGLEDRDRLRDRVASALGAALATEPGTPAPERTRGGLQ